MRCKPAGITSHRIGSIVPALAKNARTGHPQFRNGKQKTNFKARATRPGPPPSTDANCFGWCPGQFGGEAWNEPIGNELAAIEGSYDAANSAATYNNTMNGLQTNSLFGGQDCVACWPLGASPADILQQVLSGNLAGALQNAGVFPMDGVDCTSGVCMPSWIMDAGNAANKDDTHPGLQIFYNNRNCPHCGDLWKQANCTFNGTLSDELGSLTDTAASAGAVGAITARSEGTSITQGAAKEIGRTFTELFGIIEYAKTMAKIGYRMVAGCE